MRALGGEVVLHGDSYSDAYAHALELEKRARPHLRPSLRRPRRDRRPGHDRDGDPAPAPGPDRRGVRRHRRRRPDLGRRRLHQGGAARDQGDRRADERLRRDAALGRRRRARRRCADVGLFSDGTAVKLVGEETFRLARELVDEFIVVDTDAVCAAIKDVFEDTRSILEPAGALGVAAIKQYVARARHAGRDLRRHHLRRQHELRPAALRRRARRGRRGARGAVRGHDPRGARQLPALLRADRPARA